MNKHHQRVPDMSRPPQVHASGHPGHFNLICGFPARQSGSKPDVRVMARLPSIRQRDLFPNIFTPYPDSDWPE